MKKLRNISSCESQSVEAYVSVCSYAGCICGYGCICTNVCYGNDSLNTVAFGGVKVGNGNLSGNRVQENSSYYG